MDSQICIISTGRGSETEDAHHKTWFIKDKSYKLLSKLSDLEVELIMWRSGIKAKLDDGSFSVTDESKVCCHHYCVFVKYYGRFCNLHLQLTN